MTNTARPSVGTLDVVDSGGDCERQHDVRTLHQIHVRNRDRRLDEAGNAHGPRTRRIDQHPGRALQRGAALIVGHRHAVAAEDRTLEARRHCELRAQRQRRLHHCAGEQRIVRLRVVIADDGVETAGLESVQRGPFAPGHRAEAGAGIESSQQRVHPQSQLELPGPAPRVAVHRNEKRLELDQFSGNSQVNGAFAQTLSHQRELAGFKVAQSAVNQFAGSAGCAAGETEPLDEQSAMARGCGGLQYSSSVNAAADDDYIVLFHCHKRLRNSARMREYIRTHHFLPLSPFANSADGAMACRPAFPRIAARANRT